MTPKRLPQTRRKIVYSCELLRCFTRFKSQLSKPRSDTPMRTDSILSNEHQSTLEQNSYTSGPIFPQEKFKFLTSETFQFFLFKFTLRIEVTLIIVPETVSIENVRLDPRCVVWVVTWKRGKRATTARFHSLQQCSNVQHIAAADRHAAPLACRTAKSGKVDSCSER